MRRKVILALLRLFCALLLCLLSNLPRPASAGDEPASARDESAASKTTGSVSGVEIASIGLVEVATAPKIDGILNDACWKEATLIKDFWRTQFDAPALEKTEAWICCTKDAIYVSFFCHDSKPAEIRASQKKRQGNLSNDDMVQVGLDVRNSTGDYYNFAVNPLGTQSDTIPGGTSEKVEWKGDWKAGAQINADGWTAEIEIPFSILRYPSGQKSFGFVLNRTLAREKDNSNWPVAYARYGDAAHDATLTDMKLPSTPFRYVFMPYTLSVATIGGGDSENTGGLDFKGTLPSGISLLGTYNPDFRNIEDTVETIDFTFVERYLDDYRPFFQEGVSYLPENRIFYSRRIGELDLGTKAFGDLGAHHFGVLNTYQQDGGNHLAMKYNYSFGTTGNLGFFGVDRRVSGEPDNQAYALNTSWNWPLKGGGNYAGATQYLSKTEGSGGDGGALNVYAGQWHSEGLSWWATYEDIGKDFYAADGYTPETGVKDFVFGAGHFHQLDDGALQVRHTQGQINIGESSIGKRNMLWLEHNLRWRNGLLLTGGAHYGERDNFDVTDTYLSCRWNERDLYRTGFVNYTWGERYGKPYQYQAIGQAFRPTKKLSAQISLERVSAAYFDGEAVVAPEWFQQVVLTTVYDLTNEKSISARVVQLESDTNAYLAYRQRLRAGMDLLIIIGDPNGSKWVNRLAIKAVRCF